MEELLACLPLEFKQYLGGRLFQTLSNFSLFKCFLDSSISSEDPRLAIEGYKLLRCDHPSNLRRGRVCLYFKGHLPLAITCLFSRQWMSVLSVKFKMALNLFFVNSSVQFPKSKHRVIFFVQTKVGGNNHWY